MPMNFSRQINSFKSNFPVILVRVSGVYISGNWVESVLPPRELSTVSVQPITGREMSTLPENYHNEKTLKFYTLEELNNTDILEYRGERFKVHNSKLYDNIGDYFVNIASEVH